MSWGEATRLVGVLSEDPSSRFAASAARWDMAVSPEWMLLADLYDAFGHANFKRSKPYPRPFRADGGARYGHAGKRSREEVLAILRAHGHDMKE